MTASLILLGAATTVPAQGLPAVEGKAFLLLDQQTGESLFERAADKRFPPASLTKLLTALVVVEEGNLNDTVTVSRHAVSIQGKKILQAGETYRLGDLLTALMVASSNDAALAAAEHVAGSEKAFVKKMNARAKELGLKQTRIANPHGLDAKAHFSTARDLARLTLIALSHHRLAELASLHAAEIAPLNDSRKIPLETTNILLGHYPGLNGVKTGYTRRAGRCLIATAEREGKRVLLVMLGARERWWAAMDLLDYGLARASYGRLFPAARVGQ
ncbi:MAG: D-alanyl-D-alanine carboxypeptidase [Nitrospirae bacterium]|nr:D-alanyl-D-alanine carboxypeptidase [Nitrospirota bacterium]